MLRLRHALQCSWCTLTTQQTWKPFIKNTACDAPFQPSTVCGLIPAGTERRTPFLKIMMASMAVTVPACHVLSYFLRVLKTADPDTEGDSHQHVLQRQTKPKPKPCQRGIVSCDALVIKKFAWLGHLHTKVNGIMSWHGPSMYPGSTLGPWVIAVARMEFGRSASTSTCKICAALATEATASSGHHSIPDAPEFLVTEIISFVHDTVSQMRVQN